MIPANVTCIEWLNRVQTKNPSFIAANDKKICLWKLNQEVLDSNSDSDESEQEEPHSFVQKLREPHTRATTFRLAFFAVCKLTIIY